VNNAKKQSPGCLEVIGGLLLLLVISAILRAMSANVQRQTFDQIYHYRTQSGSASPFGPIR